MSIAPIQSRVIEGDVGSITTPPAVRLSIRYREIGAGPDEVEITWEIEPPDAKSLADLVVRLLNLAVRG